MKLKTLLAALTIVVLTATSAWAGGMTPGSGVASCLDDTWKKPFVCGSTTGLQNATPEKQQQFTECGLTYKQSCCDKFGLGKYNQSWDACTGSF